MLKYGGKRLIISIITLLIVTTLTFFLMNIVPGGPFDGEKALSPEATQALEEKYGLDQPLIIRYKNYMASLLQGDFGESMRQRSIQVSDLISTKFPVSAKIGGIAALVAVIVGVPLGCLAALNRGKIWDKVIILFTTLGIAIPSFILAVYLAYFIGVKLEWLPAFWLGDAKSYILPVIALSCYPAAYIIRQMRSSMLDVLGQDYMRTARAKGLPQSIRLFKHALRNAILPVVTYLGPMLAGILTGSFVVEKIFNIPGLGGEFVKAVNGRDYTMIMGTTIFLATLIIALNFLVDIAYKIIDPRIDLK